MFKDDDHQVKRKYMIRWLLLMLLLTNFTAEYRKTLLR